MTRGELPLDVETDAGGGSAKLLAQRRFALFGAEGRGRSHAEHPSAPVCRPLGMLAWG